MSNEQVTPTIWKRLGKMKAKTFFRWVVAIVVLGGVLYFGRPFLVRYLSATPTDGTSDTTGTAGNESQGPQQIRHWTLQAQYEGPLKDTVVQRWSDPDNGAVCYIYLPVIVQRSKPLQNGMVYYGANGIGSISCLSTR